MVYFVYQEWYKQGYNFLQYTLLHRWSVFSILKKLLHSFLSWDNLLFYANSSFNCEVSFFFFFLLTSLPLDNISIIFFIATTFVNQLSSPSSSDCILRLSKMMVESIFPQWVISFITVFGLLFVQCGKSSCHAINMLFTLSDRIFEYFQLDALCQISKTQLERFLLHYDCIINSLSKCPSNIKDLKRRDNSLTPWLD